MHRLFCPLSSLIYHIYHSFTVGLSQVIRSMTDSAQGPNTGRNLINNELMDENKSNYCSL